MDALTQNHLDDIRTIRNDNLNEWGHADWSILDDRRGPLPEFPVNIFSDGLRAYLKRAAAGAGVTVAHVAVPLISIASGLVGTARRVQPARGWSEPLAIGPLSSDFPAQEKHPASA